MPSARTRDWTDTRLWKLIQSRATENPGSDAADFLPNLTIWMRLLEALLRLGGTSPQDFTLHDADHSFRVAERMWQLITPDILEDVSDAELSLLLLAAYGHDVGMTPERNNVLAHHRHLFGHDTNLTKEEKSQFQTFLDEYPAGRPFALPLGSNLDDLNLADEITTFYVRARHNDWSADWLRRNLAGPGFERVPDFLGMLIRLCASHHWEFNRLRQEDFDPILIGSGNQTSLIHLRHLACLLRLADILENDPERTPEVLFRHRAIADREKSIIHWQKDHALTIDLQDKQLKFQARPKSAAVHKALSDLADAIDHELQGIACFGERLPSVFKCGEKTIVRNWHLAPALLRDIRPADQSYEYIDGAFRPDTSRLLQLLSGEQLYGNPLVAIRELLQNAFDAVREKIARRRLDPHIENPADRSWEEKLGNDEKVTLTLRPDEQGGWLLVCEDSGVGLTRNLINNHLLVSGNNRRHDIRELERRCEAKGFRLARTGQFGIGVLSYFMLADEVEITTTRSQLCGDEDAKGWTFHTRGVGSFGELRKLPLAPFASGGTRIIWKLRKDQIEDPDNPGYIGTLGLDILFYLKQTLIRIPCRFEFKTEGITGEQISWKRFTGWVKTEEDWLNWAKQAWIEPKSYYASNPDDLNQFELEFQKAEYARRLNKSRKSLLCEFAEVELPNQSGHARFVVHHYGSSDDTDLLPLSPYGFRGLQKHENVAWNGMKVNTDGTIIGILIHGWKPYPTTEASLAMEVDLASANDLSLAVNRNKLDAPIETLISWRIHLEHKPIALVTSVCEPLELHNWLHGCWGMIY